jgi:uncharacterized protein (TIGR01777 family)
MEHMKIVLTGATGLIGKELSLSLLKSGNEVRAFARKPKDISFLPEKQIATWEPGKIKLDLEFISGNDAVIHLAGSPVADGRWTEERKKEIFDSRVLGTREWAEALTLIPSEKRPKVFICASAIGIYGERGDETLGESSSSGSGFLAKVTIAWEKEVEAIQNLGIRVVLLRTGVVLAKSGGALAQMQPVVLGDGKQWMSWIHIADEIRLIEFALTNEKVEGALNLTAPNPVDNHDFTHAFAKAVHVPLVLSTPKFAIQAAFGEMSEVVLGSQRVLPEKALATGFQFLYPTISEAFVDLFRDRGLIDTYLESAQFVPETLPKVFSFFSLPENLGTLTPEFLEFKILKQSTAKIQEGTLIDYRIKVHGVPMTWRTLIKEWNEQKSFVDTQLKGPYTKWHHEHLFYEVKGGTLIVDRVTYRVPVSIVGKLLLGKFIRKDVDQIFSFRRSKINELFGNEKHV